MTYFIFPGMKRHYLTVKAFKEKNARGKKVWICTCLCGGETELETNTLMSLINPTKSCGRCEWHIKHKEAYTSWMAMKQRCDNPDRKDYKYYGGRGITYDNKWIEFINFYLDMGDPPKDIFTGERLSLDRRDNDKSYCKENCKWSTRSEQQLNKSTS